MVVVVVDVVMVDVVVVLAVFVDDVAGGVAGWLVVGVGWGYAIFHIFCFH